MQIFFNQLGEDQDCNNVHHCPACHESGVISKLKLFKISFDEAIFMCTANNCLFPFLEETILPFLISCKEISQKFDKNVFINNNDVVNDISFENLPLLQQANGFDTIDIDKLFDDPPVCFENLLFDESKNYDNSKVEKSCDFSSSFNFCDDPTTCDEHIDKPLQKINCISENTFESKCHQDPDVQLFRKKDKELFHRTEKSSSDLTTEPYMPELRSASEFQKSPSMSKISPPFEIAHNQDKENSELSQSIAEQFKAKELIYLSKSCSLLQWKNENNLCWLDVILLCVINSNPIRAAINLILQSGGTDSVIYRLCQRFDDVQSQYNNLQSCTAETKDEASSLFSSISEKMNHLRIDIFVLLQNKFSLVQGQAESVIEMFPNILKFDQTVKKVFTVNYRMEFMCNECQYKQLHHFESSYISFQSIFSHFHPLNATFSSCCMRCKANQQTAHYVLEKIPACLMMHFQEGLPHNQFQVLDFGVQGHLYSVVFVIQYVSNPYKHFVAWIRNVKTNAWLCCDGLKESECQWTLKPPRFSPKEIHIIVWEKQGLSLTLPYNHQEYLSCIENTVPLLFEPYPDSECLETVSLLSDDDEESNYSLSDIESIKLPTISIQSSDCNYNATSNNNSISSTSINDLKDYTKSETSYQLSNVGSHSEEEQSVDFSHPSHVIAEATKAVADQVIPYSWLKSALSPVVVLEDCLKKKEHRITPAKECSVEDVKKTIQQPKILESKLAGECTAKCETEGLAEHTSDKIDFNCTLNQESVHDDTVASGLCDSVLPTLDDEKHPVQLSAKALKVVVSDLHLGNDVISQLSPERPSRKRTLNDLDVENTVAFASDCDESLKDEEDSDESLEDEEDEWLPPPLKRKCTNINMKPDKPKVHSPSNEATGFLNLPQKIKPVCKKLLSNYSQFDSYKPKHTGGLPPAIEHSSGKPAASEFVSTSKSEFQFSFLPRDEVDSGCGDCYSTTAPVATDFHSISSSCCIPAGAPASDSHTSTGFSKSVSVSHSDSQFNFNEWLDDALSAPSISTSQAAENCSSSPSNSCDSLDLGEWLTDDNVLSISNTANSPGTLTENSTSCTVTSPCHSINDIDDLLNLFNS